MKAQQIPKVVRDALAARSGGLCELCGKHGAIHAHHRRPRGMGGSRDAQTNTLANLLHVSVFCHEEIEWLRAESIRNGWLVKQCHDPTKVPVLYRGTFVFLSDDGEVREASDAELIEAALTLGYEVAP